MFVLRTCVIVASRRSSQCAPDQRAQRSTSVSVATPCQHPYCTALVVSVLPDLAQSLESCQGPLAHVQTARMFTLELQSSHGGGGGGGAIVLDRVKIVFTLCSLCTARELHVRSGKTEW